MNKLVKENLFEFGKGNDPLKTLNLGKYQVWRDTYNNKPIITILIYCYNNFSDKYFTYSTDLIYRQHFDNFDDCLYFDNEQISKVNNTGYTLYEKSNRYTFFKGDEDAWTYINKELFNIKIIDKLENSDEGAIQILNNYVKDNYEYSTFDPPYTIINLFKTLMNNKNVDVHNFDVRYNKIH